MLIHLEIKNVALIDEVAIDFGQGLNILSGETGAGKSIVIDSIGSLIGNRFGREIIREGTKKAIVQAQFSSFPALVEALKDCGIESEDDETVIISREINASGKGLCRINGRLITISMLKRLGEHLIDIHGQFENQSLLKPQNHIALLDEFEGQELIVLKNEYKSILIHYKNLSLQLNELKDNVMKREQRKDMLSFQLDEIKRAAVKIGEEDELILRRDIISNSEKIITALSAAYEHIYSGSGRNEPAIQYINSAESELHSILKYAEKFRLLVERLEGINLELDDISSTIRDEKEKIEYDPAVLENIEERLDLLFKLKRKYGKTISEVIEYGNKVESELLILSEAGEKADELEKLISEDAEKLEGISIKMHNKRIQAGILLEEKISDVLAELEMKNTVFKVELVFNNAKGFGPNGCDNVEFLISPNPGEALKPLSKIASGGEMSRIMLAIKTILAAVDKMPTLIFDEIDNGIGGKASNRVGEKLDRISAGHQVLCVTHLAQIACMADQHFVIEKNTDGLRTHTSVRVLSKEERIGEIARLLDGANISVITVKHAEEMIEKAFQVKKSNIS